MEMEFTLILFPRTLPSKALQKCLVEMNKIQTKVHLVKQVMKGTISGLTANTASDIRAGPRTAAVAGKPAVPRKWQTHH